MKFLVQILLICIAITAVWSSSHSEAPNTASIPNADITDLYAFNSYETGRSAYVTFLMNAYPLQSPYGGPNYYSLSTQHFYEIYLDRNGDGTEDYTFQWIYGNSLPSSSPLGRPYIYQEDLQCQELYSTNTTPSQPATPINLGIGLYISNSSLATQSQRIAVKVAGVILGTGGSLSNLNWQEYYFLNLLTGPLISATVTNLTNQGSLRFDKPFDYAGEFSFGTASTYETYAKTFISTITLTGTMSCGATASTGKVFVGQRQDPFYISLGRIFDYLNLIPVVLQPFASATIAECTTNNDLREKNVATFGLEIPIACLGATNGLVNVWAGTRMLYHNPGDLVGSSHIAGPQVSRMGNPLVNELVIGLIDKNRYSRQHPRLDADPNFGFLSYVLYPTLPAIVNARYLAAVNQILGAALTTLAPPVPRNDLVTAFLTGIAGVNQSPFAGDVIRLNTTIPASSVAAQDRLGIIGTFLTGNLTDFAGFPNGRRPGDDVVDIALMVMMGAMCAPAFTSRGFVFCSNLTAPIGGIPLTDGSPVRASYYQTAFPYFNTPTPGSYVESNPGNVVTNPTVCYPASQHGRCPICATPASGSAVAASASASTGLTPTASPQQASNIPASPCPGSGSSTRGFLLDLIKLW